MEEKLMEPGTLQYLATFMHEGGSFMWVILAVWAVGMAISIERFKSLFLYDVDAPSLMKKIKKFVLENDVQSAIKICSDTKSLLPLILKSGLKRANQEREQIQDAVESVLLEATPKVERRLNYLSLAANISTLLGLLGTIAGLIESFAAVAQADPSAKAELLALGISKAMNTTALGLISAISIMVFHSFLSNKAEKINTELEEYAVKLIDLLSTKKGRKSGPRLPELPSDESVA